MKELTFNELQFISGGGCCCDSNYLYQKVFASVGLVTGSSAGLVGGFWGATKLIDTGMVNFSETLSIPVIVMSGIMGALAGGALLAEICGYIGYTIGVMTDNVIIRRK